MDARNKKGMLCLECRYSLEGLAEARCPECGREFDPKDAATYLVPRVWMVSRALCEPPDFWHFLFGVAGTSLVLAAFAEMVVRQGVAEAGVVLWLAVAAVVVPRMVIRLTVPRERLRVRVAARRFWVRVGMLGLVAAPMLLSPDLVLRARYLIQLPMFARVVETVEQSPFSVIDLEGSRAPTAHAIAAFKVERGVAIEIRPRRETGFAATQWCGVARIAGRVWDR